MNLAIRKLGDANNWCVRCHQLGLRAASLPPTVNDSLAVC